QKAVELYKKACDGGNMLGCSNLGTMYAKGSGVEKDFSKAKQLFKKACDGGDMDGCRNLDIIHMLMAK
ncbi:tetratricopeptide repeat protein, partial [Campylobacter sp.]|uniref:tetratricopeptide repeat protein n=1 Tax=Campylobacter sp. TaxID=205 RepID=UPI002AA72187